jgi:N-acetylglucosaminyldiphosphoundecaprenol N-acetyl-beta-D-mannosaminyltransferase
MANILGIKTGEKNIKETKEIISSFYQEAGAHQIVTPNPEIILKSQKDEELFYILNKAELSLADGFGLKLAAFITKQALHRYTGADLLPFLLQEACDNGRKVLVINNEKGLSSLSEINDYLLKNYPNLKFLVLDLLKSDQAKEGDITKIQAFSPELAICLFGAPFQEKFIFHLQEKLPNIKLGVGLGGAFDFLTKKVKRAPYYWRYLGLEWLWRLIQQPHRLSRIWRATFVFSTKFFYWAFIMPKIYRANVAVLIYRQGEETKEILIVERQDQKDHWQIPQGGRGGLSIIKAGLKEAREETGITSFTIKRAYKNLYRYQFDKELGKYKNIKNKRHFGYRGQRQSLLIIEFTGDDKEININHWDHSNWRWVDEKEFLNSIHPARQEAAAIYLKKLKQL